MEIYTSSELSTFTGCPYAWYWGYYRGLKRFPTLSQLVGSAVHLGLSLRSKGRDWDKEMGLLFSEETMGLISQAENIQNKLEMSKLLVEHFPLDKLRVLQSEIVFQDRIKIPETGWSMHNARIAGKVDALADLPGGGRWIVEYKTTSTLDENFLKKLRLELQGQIYMDHFPLPTRGLLYAVIQKPLIRQKKTETREEFFGRLKTEITDENYRFMFVDRENETEAIEQSRTEVINIIRYIKQMTKEKAFWHAPSACRNWRGCAYTDLCLSRVLDPPDDLTTKFRMYDTKHPELLDLEERKELPF
jgi:hypothetical protein